mmetsp:Transcript_3670/g.8369  ORF Transcript_3670/g.8369 Transcript_3670/m.8369 type:complete len:96 (+) Transcript_3670:107-394(+)
MSTRVSGSRLSLWVPGIQLLDDAEAHDHFIIPTYYRPAYKRTPRPEEVPIPPIVRKAMGESILAIIKPEEDDTPRAAGSRLRGRFLRGQRELSTD